MTYPEGSLLGTALCHTLRTEHAWEGLILIHTANDEPDAVESYVAAGADGCIGKAAGDGNDALLAKVAAGYHRKYAVN